MSPQFSSPSAGKRSYCTANHLALYARYRMRTHPANKNISMVLLNLSIKARGTGPKARASMYESLAEFASADAKCSDSFFAGTCASRKILLTERTSSEQASYRSLQPKRAKAHSFRCTSSSKLKYRFNFEKDVLPESSSNAAKGIAPYSGK